MPRAKRGRQYTTSNGKTLLDKIGANKSYRLKVNAAMADEAMLAFALGGVTGRRNALYGAYEADNDEVSFTRNEVMKQSYFGGYRQTRHEEVRVVLCH